ncbi:MAG: cytochrome P450 [bacterium]
MKPVEWAKSFTGDGLPDGPNDDYYTGVKFSWYWYQGNMEKFMDLYLEHGPVFTVRIMGLKVIVIIGAEANQYMYVDNWRDFYWWGEAVQGHLAELIGNGLLASVDEKHDKARRLLDPVFSKETLQDYARTMVEHTESEVQRLADQEGYFDFYEWVYDVALINASACFMGMDTNKLDLETLHEHFETCVKFYQEPILAQTLRGPFTPHRRFKQSKEKLDDMIYEEIEDRRRAGYERGDNILDRLLGAEDQGDTFSNDEIHDQIINLYWAGHDTTISAVSWLIFVVGKYPNVYEKLKTEIDERVGTEPIEVEEVTDGLPYLEMVMDEALRMYPPAWIALRKSRKEFEIYGETIPADTELAFSSFLTHRLPHLYENPDAFIPERMTPEKKRERPPGSYIPFARGPRTCIGMNFAKYEIKIIVATLLRHFDYELRACNNLRGYPAATMTPGSVKIGVSPRDSHISTPTEDIPRSDHSEESDENGCPVH